MRSPEPSAEESPLALAIVLLASERGVAADAVKSALERLFPDVPVASVEGDANGSSFTLRSSDDAEWIVSHMPGPVPAADLEGALPLSPGVSDDAAVLAHRTHLIVVSRGGALSAVERRSHLSIGVAAAAEASDAVGVYWGEGNVLHEVAPFVDEVKNEPVPVALWFGVSMARPSEDEIEFLTLGLRFVAHPDLLVSAGLADADEAFSFLYDCACYAVGNGKLLAAGESVGLGEGHALRIEAIDSPIEPGVEVLAIRYEAGP